MLASPGRRQIVFFMFETMLAMLAFWIIQLPTCNVEELKRPERGAIVPSPQDYQHDDTRVSSVAEFSARRPGFELFAMELVEAMMDLVKCHGPMMDLVKLSRADDGVPGVKSFFF
ncbi:hypothetical protein B0T16DRAFT_107143 [Cercophora newfieldiana]|uniref:Uncharacterized protein n=1 Tax=Cercophora newfieldiana TaxID=92897 RepID=A0AA39YHT6_9PEZI|nr:hypothetical protein B0T16DRAFT_107143 [Cercophora newfieldiana]